jgi:hypothetical protein
MANVAGGVALARDGQSAQADFANFQRRIHSLVWRVVAWARAEDHAQRGDPA